MNFPYQVGDITYYTSAGDTDIPIWKDGYLEGYKWNTYKYCKGSGTTLTKYVPQSKASEYGLESYHDDKLVLDITDDVAAQSWGGEWVVPTHDQHEEIYSNCYWVWTNTYNGKSVNGYVVYKAKNIWC